MRIPQIVLIQTRVDIKLFPLQLANMGSIDSDHYRNPCP